MPEPDTLVPVHFRRIDEKVDRLIEEMRDVKVRLTAVEDNLAGLHRRLDRLEAGVARIERRLHLADAPR